MPRRAALLLLAVCALCACVPKAPSPQALDLRKSLDLVPHSPPPEVLSALFTADEDAPRLVFGPVSAFATARACPATWLIEQGEKARLERLAARKDAPAKDAPAKDALVDEFSLTLEEDCGGTVTHFVFVFAPGTSPELWLKWRGQFHGSKAPRHYATALERLKRAQADGLLPTAQLRFVSVGGELALESLEERLRAQGAKPLFDLEAGRRPGS